MLTSDTYKCIDLKSALLIKTTALHPHPENPRIHSKKQIDQLAKSMQVFGFVMPILIDENNRIIAGHGRVLAAQQLGMKEVPAIRVEHLTEGLKLAYMMADNKLTENSSWNRAFLKKHMQWLVINAPTIELSVTGFDIPEIDIMLIEDEDEKEAPLEIDESAPVVTKFGDLWQLGNHFILCANALEEESFTTMFPKGGKAEIIFTDPPYNVPVDGHTGGLGKIKHAEFAMASGEMSKKEFIKFLAQIFTLMVRYSANGSIHYVCMDWRHLHELLEAALPVYSDYKNLCVWNKDNAGMGSLYRSKHELIAVFKNGDAAHVNNVELGKHGRYRTNVWDYPGQTSIGTRKNGELMLHPTVKPLDMVADALMDCSRRDDLVLDPFGGSGTTLLAAEKTGRRARLIEIEPRYVDVTIRRWQQVTGKQAVHTQSGKTFNTMQSSLAAAAGKVYAE